MQRTSTDDPLQEEYFNKEAISDLADSFDLSYEEAVILWCRFVGTVDKLRELTKRLRREAAEAERAEGKGAGSNE